MEDAFASQLRRYVLQRTAAIRQAAAELSPNGQPELSDALRALEALLPPADREPR